MLFLLTVSVNSLERNKLLSKEIKWLCHIKRLDHFKLNGIENGLATKQLASYNISRPAKNLMACIGMPF